MGAPRRDSAGQETYRKGPDGVDTQLVGLVVTHCVGGGCEIARVGEGGSVVLGGKNWNRDMTSPKREAVEFSRVCL
jgi:hypothetical protein